MYIQDGICYAGENGKYIELPIVVEVKALSNHKLYLRFKNGKEGIYDFTPLLQRPCYTPLQDENVFANVYLEYGIPTWNNGEIDIAPETLFKDCVAVA